MEKPTSLINTLFEKTEQYVKSSGELFKLKAIDKSANLISTIVERLAVMVVFSFFILFASIGIALSIGQMCDKSSTGFFIVAGFYAVVSLFLYFFGRKWIKAPLRNLIIQESLK